MANIERIEQRKLSSLLEPTTNRVPCACTNGRGAKEEDNGQRPSRDSRRQSQKNEALNRLRVVPAEQEKTNRWLAEQLGKTEHTISRWCHNKSQPSVAQLNEIAQVLNVDVRSLITTNMQ